PYERGWEEVALTAALFVVLVGAFATSMVRESRTWVDRVPVYLAFPLIALARDLTGGTSSGVATLVVLPLLWLAMTGTRRDLAVAAVLTGLTFLLPMLVIGEPDYPTGDWRRALLWTAVAVLVAPVVQRLVRDLGAESARAREALAEVDGIMRSARLTSLIT